MEDQKRPKILFTDYFGVTKQTLKEYGAFNVSLVTDLPLFVDPFLLFNSKDGIYQKLHEDIIRYLRFLKDKSANGRIDKGLLREWYRFKEVRQNWLGFSVHNNSGHGLGDDFATALNASLNSIFNNFGNEQITAGSHLERLCLIKDGVGRDNISDFTVNLIKGFLLGYTQDFARKYIDPRLCMEFAVEKVSFNYSTESWERGVFFLPMHNDDFVLLTPRDMLTKDDGWINRSDLIDDFHQIPTAISDEGLRSQINNYFRSVLPAKPKKKDEREAAFKTIQHFPVLVDYFIKYKEDHGEHAKDLSEQKITLSETLYGQQFVTLANLLAQHTNFYEKGNTYEETRERLAFFKDVIEKNDGYRLFYVNGQPIKTEDDLQLLFRFVWFATSSDVNREPNNGRGPADYAISRGAVDKTILEFKLARNKKLKKNLQKQLEIYKDANGTEQGMHAIIYFSEAEFKRVNKILVEVGLFGNSNVILIDARSDNKPSASNA
jgi:hypothetical protein